MANRLDTLPKVYGEALCDRCAQTFTKTGPNNKRCDLCKRGHKQEYERTNKRARHVRRSACERCGASFPPDIHAATIRCAPCASAVRQARNNESGLRRHHRIWRNDPGHRLHLSMSVLTRRALGKSKAGMSWENILGYDLAALRLHLERQFLRGMSWDNFGQWQVDHILPRSSFRFMSPDDPEFKACWALTNLRPLWAVDNLRKNGKRLHLI